MADVSLLSRLQNGAQRQVDLSQNNLVVGVLKVGTSTPTSLTKAILDNLVALQNGTDFSTGTNSHTHDGRYFTQTQLGSTTLGSAGSTRIGDNNSYSYFTPSAATVKGALAGIDAALGTVIGITTFDDSTFAIFNHTTPSKKIAFSAAGISSSTTRTITMPDSNVDLGLVATAIQKDGSVTFTADQPMGSHKLTGLSAGSSAGHSVRYEQAILVSGANAFAADQSFGGFKATNVADPVSGTDAVNLNYLSARLNGLKPKQSVSVATLVNTTLSGEQTIDGVLTSSSRVLVMAQSAPANNGIYDTASGSWTRSADFDSLSPIDEINGAWVAVQNGTVNAGKIFVQYGTVATLGTDAINFEYFNPIASLIGGDMITFSSSTFSVDLATTSGLESTNPGNNAGQLRVKLEASNPSLQIDGSNQLGAKLSGSGALTSGASGIAVQVDGSTLEINTNALRQKDAGTTAAKLNTNAFDQTTITGGAGSAAAVQDAPRIKNRAGIAGQSFSATTTYAVRYGQPANGETSGRLYACDKDATSLNNYNCVGLIQPAGAIVAGNTVTLIKAGSIGLAASDANFSSGDVGTEAVVGASGAVIAISGLTGATGEASAVVGIIQSVNQIDVGGMHLRGIA